MKRPSDSRSISTPDLDLDTTYIATLDDIQERESKRNPGEMRVAWLFRLTDSDGIRIAIDDVRHDPYALG